MAKHTIIVNGEVIPVETCDHAQTTSMVIGTPFRWDAYAYSADEGATRGSGPTEQSAIDDLREILSDP